MKKPVIDKRKNEERPNEGETKFRHAQEQSKREITQPARSHEESSGATTKKFQETIIDPLI